jgi:glycerol-3-phosphate acyltransferase PlsY
MITWLILCGVVFILAYLCGSFPTGYIVGKQLQGIDIREYGSGSTGATNVLRTLGKVPGTFVLLVDCGKGVLAIALVHALHYYSSSLDFTAKLDIATGQPWLITLAGLAAILGHSKSIFLGFTGGKSVATSLGILLAISWEVGLATLAVFACVLVLSRIVSLSSIIGALSVSIFMIVFQQPLPYLLLSIAGGLYVIFRHHSNIQRLITGTEAKIGQMIITEPEQPV